MKCFVAHAVGFVPLRELTEPFKLYPNTILYHAHTVVGRDFTILLLVLASALDTFCQNFPTVSVTSPTHGSTLPPGFITLTAEASDPDGEVVKVQYYIDDVADEFGTSPPYQATLNIFSGRHKVQAVATDNDTNITWSAAILFQVDENPVNLVRGPYLQSCTATSIVVCWRTDWPTNSVVRHGTNQNVLNSLAISGARTGEHQLLVSGLAPDVRYYYSVESSSQVLSSSPLNQFRSAPTNARPVTVWVIGDSGTANAKASTVRDVYVDAVEPFSTDLWLMLGDNAYENGTDAEYQAAVFNMYRDILRSVPLWPTIGNHDAGTGPPQSYLNIFSLPQNGEAGGVPSGSENYYSFDYANVHFICLDSYASSRAPGDPMLMWLREDLGATDKDWIVAFWHHPPYSFGSHNSDTDYEMIEMRSWALPILEAGGADLVLSGHSHVYERSFLLNGHYGFSSTLAPAMILDASSGSAGYRKPAGGLGNGQGTVYMVCGASGEGGSGLPFPLHPAMFVNSSVNGSVILNFDGLQMSARFLASDGAIADAFNINKGESTTMRPELNITRTNSGAILSWPTSIPSFSLQETLAVATNAPWQSTTDLVMRVGRRNVVNIAPQEGKRFFRLRSNP